MREPGAGGVVNEKTLHLLFQLTLGFKAIFALAEIAAGVATYLVPRQYLLVLVLWVTRDEFAEGPHDLVANFLLRSVQHLSVVAANPAISA